ncbi:hypothetical protein BG006_009600 [Podila minutissima]|uniref:Fanconi-associated nuclease n=1 Tax=Podila minutissima TaxID=64525 RepID=A0A9P5VJC2_9FUNG|nr:hypothetical protein BG006_009600 [Podila minutissima]
MKKNGTTKAATTNKATKKAAKPTNDSKAGDKRQLPLDFSRHALRPNFKKQTPDAVTDATNNASNTHRQTDDPSTIRSSQDPPVIHVNFVRSTTATTNIVETTSESNESEENETEQEDDLGYGDDDDLVLALRDMPEDDEDEEETGSTAEESPTADGLVDVKPERIEDQKDEMLLPIQYRWKTVYVAAFELALDTVLPNESFLFTDEERALFETYRALPDDPKHLFVRLFLRNQKFWIRKCKLDNQYREIVDLDSAIQELVSVGLLMDQNSLQDAQEAIAMLCVDELKQLARRVGIKEKLSGKMRRVIVSTIMERFRQQSFISKRLLLAPGGDADGGQGRKTGLATQIFSGDSAKRDVALIEKIIDISGPCVKIYPNIIRVFERLHLVFYRTKEYSEKPALIEAILAKIGQRTFPTYDITRTNTVFRNRDELLKYEEAIKLHFELSKLIDSAMGAGKDAVVYVRDADQPIDRITSGRRPIVPRTKSESGDAADPDQERRAEVVAIYERVIQEAENIRHAWRENVATKTALSTMNPSYFLLRFSPGWAYTQILRLELRALAFLKRFEEESILLHELLDQQVYSLGARGSWYDRLALIKSNYSFQKRLGKKEALQVCMMALRDKHVHAVEANLIQARIGRLETDLKVAFRERHDFSYLTLRKAQKRILTGERLNTPGTIAPAYTSSHSYSYIPGSGGIGSGNHSIANQRPLWRNIDGSDCGVEELALSYYGTLGYKGYHSENSILATLFGLLFWDILFSPLPGVFETSYQTEPLDLRTDAFFLGRQQMIMDRLESIAKSTIAEYPQDSVGSLGEDHMIKSDATDENGGVDEEGTLVRSSHPRAKTDSPIDIVPVEHVKQEQVDEAIRSRPEVKVETEDDPLVRKRRECFYLNQLQAIDDLYREEKVFCVGVNWTFEKEELLQIAECIGAHALSEICKVMAQEYRQRCSGMPDLCCWSYDKKLVKFVEVKGPGDRLSSKQQVWIDLLTSLNVDIELCIVQVSKAEDNFKQERDALN